MTSDWVIVLIVILKGQENGRKSRCSEAVVLSMFLLHHWYIIYFRNPALLVAHLEERSVLLLRVAFTVVVYLGEEKGFWRCTEWPISIAVLCFFCFPYRAEHHEVLAEYKKGVGSFIGNDYLNYVYMWFVMCQFGVCWSCWLNCDSYIYFFFLNNCL